MTVARAAYDAAWAEISSQFAPTPMQKQQGQVRLANAVLSVAGDHMMNVAELKDLALRVMAFKYNSAGITISEATRPARTVESDGGRRTESFSKMGNN
jgi:hypothetical protein